MKKRLPCVQSKPLLPVSLILAFFVVSLSVTAQNFTRLEGIWCHDARDKKVCESWKIGIDSSMLGIGSIVKNGKEIQSEALRIISLGDKTAYLAQPLGQDITSFNFTLGPNDTWIFTNQEHDFPKVIMYKWISQDSLVVSLFGKNSSPAQQYFFKRTESKLKKDIMEKSPKATGIGGIFFKCADPDNMKNWYSENLGFPTDQYGSLFEFRKAEDPNQKAYLQWSPMTEKTNYFEPSDKQFMINYRVQNIEKMVENLKASGVTICDEIATYDYGKFVHIMDPEGNKIELWEPVDEVFSKNEK
jgi:predicted enzyme related to lactoylglutathione lyase